MIPKAHEVRADSLLTSYQVGALLQVNPSSVNKWVKDGRLPAFRTPGGHRRIRAGDLVAFLSTHTMPVPTSLAQAARRRLLLVGEHVEQLQSLHQLLSPYADRLQVDSATNGVDALVAVGALQPHVVLLDAAMVSMDALEVCRRLHAGQSTHAIDVILTCHEVTAELQRRARAAGAKLCITQPVDEATLLHALNIVG